jgi:hypothetical protein
MTRIINCDICKKEIDAKVDNDWLLARMKDIFSVDDICNDCFNDFFSIVRKFRAEKLEELRR